MCKERLAERNERCTRTRTRRMCKERLAERNERCTRTRTPRMCKERLAERNERCTRTRTRRMCKERLAERNERCTRTRTRRMCTERLAERNERCTRRARTGAEAAHAPHRLPHQPAVRRAYSHVAHKRQGGWAMWGATANGGWGGRTPEGGGIPSSSGRLHRARAKLCR